MLRIARLYRNKVKESGFIKTNLYVVQSLWIRFIRRPFDKYIRNSYSQQNEDLIVEKIIGKHTSGFYVDIGANDPINLNNTYHFYKKSSEWNGIIIEPDPVKCALLKMTRPRDVILNIGISNKDSIIPFYRFEEDTLSTFSKQQADYNLARGKILQDTINVTVCPLEKVLTEHIPSSIEIDLMSIDTEGYDLEVLVSNNWQLYKPKVLIIEGSDQKILQLMTKQGYKVRSQTYLFGNLLNTIYSLS